MAIAGNSAKPSSTQEWFGLNSTNAMAQLVTLPAGGPWRIYRLGTWVAGKDSSVTGRLCLWSAGGTLARQTSNITFAGQSFALGHSSNYEGDVSDYVVAGGTQVYVGFWRDPSGAHQNGRYSSGSHLHDTQGASPESLSGWSTDSAGGISGYLYYAASNTAPSAPSYVSPSSGAILTDLTPNLVVDHNDPDGDPVDEAHFQVDNNSDYSSTLLDSATGYTVDGDRVTKTYNGTDLSGYRGQTLYWHARTADAANGYGPWSASRTFKINSLPTVGTRTPSASKLARVWNLDEGAIWSTGASAKPEFQFVYSDADGHAMSRYRVRIYNSSTGTEGDASMVHDSGEVTASAASGATVTHQANFGIVQGTERWWTVKVRDSLGEWSAESSRTAFKMRWAQGLYLVAPGSSSDNWSLAKVWTDGAGHSAFVFRSRAAGGGGESAWTTDLASVPINAELQILVRLSLSEGFGDGSAGPDLGSMTFSYLGTPASPDRWAFQPSSEWRLTPAIRRFGSQCIRCSVQSGTAGHRYGYPWRQTAGDDVLVLPQTTYTFSAFVKTAAPLTGGALSLRVFPAGDLSSPIAVSASTTDTSAYQDGWQRLAVTFTTGIGVSVVRPAIWYMRSSGVTETFYADAFKLEEGTVATAWTPGFVGDPIVLDSNGIQIDASAGGIFRMRGELGGGRDTVALGDNGLLFGGDTQLSSPAVNVLEVTGEMHSEGEDWVAPTLGNSWVNFGGTLGTAGYRKDANGFVHLKGVIKDGTITAAAFTLPTGYRPAADMRFACVSNSLAQGVLNLSSAGVVTPQVGSNVSFSLDAVIFKAV